MPSSAPQCNVLLVGRCFYLLSRIYSYNIFLVLCASFSTQLDQPFVLKAAPLQVLLQLLGLYRRDDYRNSYANYRHISALRILPGPLLTDDALRGRQHAQLVLSMV